MLSTFNVLEAAIAAGVRTVRELLERDGAGVHLRPPPVRARVPADRRGASGPAAGSVRDREVVRRAPRATAPSSARTSAAPRSARAGCRTRTATSATSGRSSAIPSVLIGNYCSYVDVHDLCDAVVLAIETDLPGHEVFYIASPDTIGGHPLEETVARHYGGEGIEFRPLDARGRVRDLEREGASGCSGGCRRAPGATTSTTTGRRTRVKHASTRATPGPSCRPSASGRGRSAGRGGSAGATSTTTTRSRRSATRVELGVNWVDTAAVYGLGHSEEVVGAGARAVPARRGRVRLHEVRPPLGGPSGGRDRERPATRVDPRGVRGEPAPARRRADRPLPVPLARLDDRHAAGGVVGDDGASSSTRARCAGSASRNFDVDAARRAARRSVTSTRSSRRSRCSRAARADGDRRGRREHGTGVIVYSPMASGLLTGAFDRERIAAARRRPTGGARRRRSRSRSSSRNLALVERLRPIAERARRRRCPRSRSRGCSRSPGVTGGDRRRSPARQVDGWSPAAELELDERRRSRRSTRRSPRRARARTRRRRRRLTSARPSSCERCRGRRSRATRGRNGASRARRGGARGPSRSARTRRAAATPGSSVGPRSPGPRASAVVPRASAG